MFNFDLEKIENEYVTQINQSLKVLEKQLNLFFIENNYLPIMVNGRSICETTTKLLLFKKEGIGDNQKVNTFYQNIEKLNEYGILPKESYNFLHLIRKQGGEVVHGMEQSNVLIFSFLKAFNYFIQWFDNYYSQNYQTMFQIEKCCELINSIIYDEKDNALKFDKTNESNTKFIYKLKLNESKTNHDIRNIKNELCELEKEKIENTIVHHKTNYEIEYHEISIKKEYLLNEKIKKLTEELKNKEELHEKQINELTKQNREILKQLDEYRKLFEKGLSILKESNERGKRMETKIDELHSKIDKITTQITTIQSLTERQLKKAQSTEEIERIISTYIDECIDNIMNYSRNFAENQNYIIEKQKLIYSIGEEGWNKLCDKSKTFLITSKVMYNHLVTMDDIIDYSGICVLITKALEVELKKRFFTDFLNYLNEKYGDEYKNYHTALLHNYRKPKFSEKFSMGDFVFVMCPSKNWNDTDEQKINNKIQLMDYCDNNIFSKYDETEIEELLNKYASSIEDIREKYRNPSAHTNEIKRINAEECFNLVLDVEKLLKQMLDSFDY